MLTGTRVRREGVEHATSEPGCWQVRSEAPGCGGLTGSSQCCKARGGYAGHDPTAHAVLSQNTGGAPTKCKTPTWHGFQEVERGP